MRGWGSWEWVGLGLEAALRGGYRTSTFSAWEDVDADVAVVVKHAPPREWAERQSGRGGLIYCPIDHYGLASDIDDDAAMLARCDRVVVHAARLARYFRAYARVSYLDHSIRFAAPPRREYRPDGPILWVGVRSNLAPLVDWVNRHGVPGPLQVLANFDGPTPSPRDLGLSAGLDASVLEWSPHLHAELTSAARAVIDIKGDDFRSTHKPPAKGIDVLASGVPLAMNPDSCTTEHLADMGFLVADPLDHDRWLSEDYWEETRRFGGAIRELLSVERVALRFSRIVEDVLAGRARAYP